MQFFPDPKVFLSFGPFHVTWYALCLLTGILLSYWLSQRTMTRWGYSKTVLDDLVIPLVFWALVGARLYYVIFQWGYYSQHPAEIIAIWNGGIAMHGSIIGGVCYSLYYCHKHHLSFLRLADAIMPNVFVGQAIGRWGNFMNQEAFGNVVSASFYDHWPAFIRNRMLIDGQYRQPTFLYESVIDLCGWLFITQIFDRYFYRHKGDNLWMYCIWYGFTRLFLELYRTDALMIGPFRQARLISMLLIIIGVLGLAGVWRRIWRKFHPEPKPAVLFDLDGTLIDSRPIVFETFEEVFKQMLPDKKLTKEELYSFFGPTLEESFSKYLPEDKVEEAIDLYQKINLKMHTPERIKVMPNAAQTLQTLKAMGCPIGIVSNKRQKVVELGLKMTGLDKYPDVVIGKENLGRAKPYPDGLIAGANALNTRQDNVIYVGDNAADIEAARNMAAFSIGYSDDEKQKAALRRAKPCRMVDDLSQIPVIVQEDHEWIDRSIW